ncbi:MAG: bifunctional riboflavin kinase/FAD synthetase [Wenzhouxiangella sp.]|jgi:riboflavin kinase/FMN adenylyltransferase|nr:bifunctional riboflavin kinase/FAD synthetase [Wenzhouxiangella sp.]
MDLIRTPDPRRPSETPVALTIGNFDGVHLGHQALIRAVVENGRGLIPALMCFEPLPATVFRPDQPVARLMGVRDRVTVCQQLGIERLFMPRFNRQFAAMSPEQFVKDLVVDAVGARHIVVGADFRFGAKAAGDVLALERLGRQQGFSVEVVDSVCQDADKISSSAIRKYLARGELKRTAAALGRPYALCGRVQHGQALGRTLGFPTVNLRPPVPPALHGVFAVRVSGAGLSQYPGVANIGCRPTVKGSSWLLEAHLFDYDGDLYGKHLSVEFVHRLRGEERFSSLDAMTRQMRRDAALARQLLADTSMAS